MYPGHEVLALLAGAPRRSVGFRECGPFGAYKEDGNSAFMSLNLSDAG